MADTTLPATQGSKNLAANKPEYLQTPELGPRGFQEMESKDMTIPRIALCQSMTPQRKRDHESFIQGLEEGQLFNTVSGQIYGDSVNVIPLFFYKTRIFFKDFDQGGGIKCQAPDGKSCQLNHGGKCLHDEWGPNGEPPECTEFFNYPVLVLPSMELAVVSLKATGIKAAKAWNSMMRMRQADMFAGIYRLSSKSTPGPANQTYYAWKIENATDVNNGWAPKEMYELADGQYTGVYEGVRTGRLVADVGGIEEETRGQANAEM